MRCIFLFLTFFTFAQQTQKLDFISASGDIGINVKERKVYGTVHYIFEVKETIDTIKIDAQKMTFSNVKINNKIVKYSNSGKAMNLFEGFKTGKNTLTFYYEAIPRQAMYFNEFVSSEISDTALTGSDSSSTKSSQVWTQGQGKYTSHWFPSFDDVNEKVVFDMVITFDKNYTVISNGVLKKVKSIGGSKKWHYVMKNPMSSYLLMLAIGEYDKKKDKSKSGIKLEYFIQPKDAEKFEPTYRYSKQIFDFLENEIGVDYPWKIYRHIPVEDFLYAGMENTHINDFFSGFCSR